MYFSGTNCTIAPGKKLCFPTKNVVILMTEVEKGINMWTQDHSNSAYVHHSTWHSTTQTSPHKRMFNLFNCDITTRQTCR